jgi:hypothetical protein
MHHIKLEINRIGIVWAMRFYGGTLDQKWHSVAETCVSGSGGVCDCRWFELLQESNAWVEEIIAKIRDILLSFSEQYRASALNGNISPNHVTNINQSFDYFFDHLSESYA